MVGNLIMKNGKMMGKEKQSTIEEERKVRRISHNLIHD